VIIEDFVMLGTTVPEPNSDGRVHVCSAGVSAEYRSLIRIYPLARRNVPRRWGEYRVRLERNPKDRRPESFKLGQDEDRRPGAHERINEQFEVVRKRIPDRERIKLLSRHVIGSIKEANARKISLAIIQPDAIEIGFEANPASAEAPQMILFDDGLDRPTVGARRFAWMPRIKFHDELGWNNLMLRDWGTFELQRKQGEVYFRRELAAALSLRSDSSLLVGNMNNQRNAWLVISVLNGIREAPTLFDGLADDRPPVSEKVRREIYARDGWKCVRCDSTDNLTVDHRHPHIRGGISEVSNYQTLCRTCNDTKGDAVPFVV
jgi:HNH endonuclease